MTIDRQLESQKPFTTEEIAEARAIWFREEKRIEQIERALRVAESFRLQFNPTDLPEGAFQLWESLGNEIERALK
jgi:hypothetical protein